MPRLNKEKKAQMDLGLSVPLENITPEADKKLALDFFVEGELEGIKAGLTDALAWDIAIESLRLSVRTLLNASPNSPEFKWEAAWVFDPWFNLEPGEEPGKMGFEALVNLLVESMPEEFGDIASPDEFREHLLHKMPEESRQAVVSGAYRVNNPYPEAV